MKHAHKHLIAGALMALGFAVTAQPATAPANAPTTAEAGRHPHQMRGQHGRMDPAQMQERMAQRMAHRHAKLKEKLQITPAQESAWTAFVAAMKPPANMQRADRAEFAKLTTPERIDRMRAIRIAHHAEMDRRGEATKTFYAALTADQQKVFDAGTPRGQRGDHRRGHHRGHHV